MQKKLLNVKGLELKLAGKQILNGVDLQINFGETHAIMGPNGSGKSTLAQMIVGNPVYTSSEKSEDEKAGSDGSAVVTNGEILFEGKNVINMEPDERARLGIFLSFQHPLEVPGVNVASFLRMIYNNKSGQNLSPVKFRTLLQEKMAVIDMKSGFLDRYLNEGFSGGEKKRMEILQMLILEPKMVILDEVDSGLDIDALKSVSKGVNDLRHKNPKTSFIIITHHARILDHINPDFVHVMQDGKIVKSGGFEIAKQLEKSGYKDFESNKHLNAGLKLQTSSNSNLKNQDL